MAQEAITRAQAARQTDLDYKYNEWYQPLRQAQTQSDTASNLFQHANDIAHYTGDYSTINKLTENYLGIPPEALPQGYASGKAGPQQVKAADVAARALPIPFTYGNTYQAGGVGAYPALPPGAPPDPEMQKAQRDALLRYWNSAYGVTPEGAPAGGPVKELDPNNGLAPPAQPIPAPAANENNIQATPSTLSKLFNPSAAATSQPAARMQIN